MKKLLILFSFFCIRVSAQTCDTLPGYQQKISGEEIVYFSPLHQFAPRALLTRTLGNMPVAWSAPVYSGNKEKVCYELLIGHSTGTSSGTRSFAVKLNGQHLFTIETQMKEHGFYTYKVRNNAGSNFQFVQQEYDLNQDGFGMLYLTVPANLVKAAANFSIEGLNQNSRDWLMVFMYAKKLQVEILATNLVLRKENKRQVNILLDNPYSGNSVLRVLFGNKEFEFPVKAGYNKLSIAAYVPEETGNKQVICILNKKDTLVQQISLRPIHPYAFNLIHHSHNDIGYSHVQTEVEQIQNNNIRYALRWIKTNRNKAEQAYWHIESLWAVENFLRIATPLEKEEFIAYVKSGNLILSANYANILTGLAQAEELNWALEYAKKLEQTYGFNIKNVMTTDIPGLSYSGFNSYVNNKIPYLSFGPNYVAALADKGDRIGSVLEQQGDKAFYWKADSSSKERLLVWTAGKGYSFFHGIPDAVQQETWEQRISDYCQELLAANYPYEEVQLRYTKISDNGPVDTMLCDFVSKWNEQFLVPQLHIASLNRLFEKFEKKYGKDLPEVTGEISPYWEDGAYSTAIEEMDNRALVLKTLSLEKALRKRKDQSRYSDDLYALHRNIVLFHEHTWGSWCSISDPEIPFTTRQWEIKKGFLDSAQYYYRKISNGISYQETRKKEPAMAHELVGDFEVDAIHGGLKGIWVNRQNLVSDKQAYTFFEPIYRLGINPTQTVQTKVSYVSKPLITANLKQVEVLCSLPGMDSIHLYYSLNKSTGILKVRYRFEKKAEKNKESLHLAMPFSDENAQLSYGSDAHQLSYPKDQLPGSNKEFICVENQVLVQTNSLQVKLSSPKIALYEIGHLLDEDKVNGSKVWKRENQNTSRLFLYVFNNYWHTNYKAYQQGAFDFEVQLQVDRNR